MQQILICTTGFYPRLTDTMVDLIKQEGYEVTDGPSNKNFNLVNPNDEQWRSHEAVIRAAIRSQGRAFVQSDDEEATTSKIISIPDDVVWEIARDRYDVEYVREVHRVWR